jgi:hypothetical protein
VEPSTSWLKAGFSNAGTKQSAGSIVLPADFYLYRTILTAGKASAIGGGSSKRVLSVVPAKRIEGYSHQPAQRWIATHRLLHFQT